MSEISKQLFDAYKEVFPHLTIVSEKYVIYKGYRLFFDFYIRELNLYIEVQGEQHSKFNKHFYSDAEDFQQQKMRDNLKVEYVQNDPLLHLIRFYHDEVITKALVLKRFNEVFNTEDGII